MGDPTAEVSGSSGEVGTGPLDRAGETNGQGAGQGAGRVISDDNVVGGTTIDISELPWTVALTFSGTTVNKCGGVLVSPTRVLTAAHCVDHKVLDANGKPTGETALMGTGDVEVTSGRTRLHDLRTGQVVKVKRVWQASQWNRAAITWDYAVLDLAEAIVDAQPVKLPSTESIGLWKEQTRVIGAGWGCQFADAYPAKPCEVGSGSPLEFTAFGVQPPSVCDAYFRGPVDATSGLCMTSESGKTNTCNGDSGGPYIVRNLRDDEWYLVGLVSYGGEGCKPGTPVVAAFVPTILDADGHLRADVLFDWCEKPTYC